MEALELDPGNKVVGNGLNQARMKNKESNHIVPWFISSAVVSLIASVCDGMMNSKIDLK